MLSLCVITMLGGFTVTSCMLSVVLLKQKPVRYRKCIASRVLAVHEHSLQAWNALSLLQAADLGFMFSRSMVSEVWRVEVRAGANVS